MVTVIQHREDNTTNPIVTLDTIEAAETFLDGLSGSYWGLPGFSAKRTPGTLTVSATIIDGAPRVISTYTINPQETLND